MALRYRMEKVDLDLVEPRGVQGRWISRAFGWASSRRRHRAPAVVGGIVVDAPEDPLGGGVRLGGLAYAGSASHWGFAICRAGHNDYLQAALPDGCTQAYPEGVLDTACGLHFGDPPPGNQPPDEPTALTTTAGPRTSASPPVRKV